MKFYKFLSLALVGAMLLAFPGCKDDDDDSEEEDVVTVEEEVCPESYELNIGASVLLIEAYVFAWELFNEATITEDDAYRRIPATDIQTMLDECLTCDGVRIYFSKESAPAVYPQAPNLVLCNTEAGCIDLLTNNYLMSLEDATPGSQTGTEAEAQTVIQLWAGVFNEPIVNPQPGWEFKEIYAYTYDRDDIEALLNQQGVTHIDFNYALVDERDPDAPAGEVQGALRMDIVMTPYPAANASIEAIDFALPCPKACDKTSPLYQGS